MMLVAASSDQKADKPHKQMSTVFHPIHTLDGATKIDNPKLCSLRLLARRLSNGNKVRNQQARVQQMDLPDPVPQCIWFSN